MSHFLENHTDFFPVRYVVVLITGVWSSLERPKTVGLVFLRDMDVDLGIMIIASHNDLTSRDDRSLREVTRCQLREIKVLCHLVIHKIRRFMSLSALLRLFVDVRVHDNVARLLANPEPVLPRQ